MNYFAANPKDSLHILYFDNKPINRYNIETVNKDPTGWKRYDDYMKGLQWYKTPNTKPAFEVDAGNKTAERNDCGCNYRFTDAFINKAIVFIIDGPDKNHSRWLLLPDDTVLLYLTEGKEVMGRRTASGFEYPCELYNLKGNIIPKLNGAH